MLTCKDASHLVSHGQDRALSFRERWGLRFHLWMCGNCRRFERQIALMRRLLRQSDQRAETEAADQALSAEARERISRALADQQSHNSKPSA
jgi:predicted anti-sigma-YlaC factor YlaD